jgi:outer membrane immunogenic protein
MHGKKSILTHMKIPMRYFLLSTCLIAGTSLAHADGASQALSYGWTGLYGGINAGYGWQNSDWDFAGGGSTSPQDNGGVVGLQIGYDAQLDNNLFVGLEASLDATSIDGKNGCLGGQTCETHVSSLGDVSARLGITSGEALYFIKGGVAYEDATHHIQSPGIDNSDNGGAALGYLVGGGIEYALLYNLTTKIEYNYMNFGTNNYTVTPNTRINVDEPISLVKVGFNLKFD